MDQHTNNTERGQIYTRFTELEAERVGLVRKLGFLELERLLFGNRLVKAISQHTDFVAEMPEFHRELEMEDDYPRVSTYFTLTNKAGNHLVVMASFSWNGTGYFSVRHDNVEIAITATTTLTDDVTLAASSKTRPQMLADVLRPYIEAAIQTKEATV